MTRATLPRRIYDFFTRRWYLSAVILTLSSQWFVILKLFGKDLRLVDAGGSFLPFTHFITWPLVVLSAVFAIVKTAADKYDEDAKTHGQFILESLLESVNAATGKKLRSYCRFIDENRGKPDNLHLRQAIDPEVQIESLLENMQITLSDIFGINRDSIGLSILYRPGTCEHWSWLCTVNAADDMDLETLVSNPSTTARQIVDGKFSSLFLPDKRMGVRVQQYVPGLRDQSFATVGSVLCRDLSIGKPDGHLQAVLSITTYGKQLCEENDARARYKIENLIVPTFERHLRTELALLFVKHHMSRI
jgi:hypothetical protein